MPDIGEEMNACFCVWAFQIWTTAGHSGQSSFFFFSFIFFAQFK